MHTDAAVGMVQGESGRDNNVVQLPRTAAPLVESGHGSVVQFCMTGALHNLHGIHTARFCAEVQPVRARSFSRRLAR